MCISIYICIGGIVDHHCLNIVFILQDSTYNQLESKCDSHQILSECDVPKNNDPATCTIDHVLQLLQRLYAIGMEQSIKQNIGMSNVCYRNGTVHQTKYRYVKCMLYEWNCPSNKI